MELDHQDYGDAVRKARLSVAAHMDALAVVQDAASLRLDHLRALILKALPEDIALKHPMILRLPPEDEARLLVDLKHSVAMGRDGRSYRLEEDGEHGRRLLAESLSADDIKAEVLRLMAVVDVEGQLASEANRSTGTSRPESWVQSALLFLAGMIFGGAGLASIAIYLKKLSF